MSIILKLLLIKQKFNNCTIRYELYITRIHRSKTCPAIYQYVHGTFENHPKLISVWSKNTMTWPRGYKTFFMPNSVENEILDARKYKNIKKFGFFLGSDKPRMLFFPLINVKMPTTVGILTFMSRKNFMLS